MKIAVAGKGGVGKTSLTAWLGDWLRRQGEDVWLVDADTTLSLGPAIGLGKRTPSPLVQNADLIRERIGSGFLNLNPDVSDLPERLATDADGMKLLVMGTLASAGGGCACNANALLKALLAHLIMDRSQTLLIDLEAGVEHLGRGTVTAADGLIVVTEPSLRSLDTARHISSMATDLGLHNQALVLNRAAPGTVLPDTSGLPPLAASIPMLDSLAMRQLTSPSVLDLPERRLLDGICSRLTEALVQHEPAI